MKEIALPMICERYIGATIPNTNQFFICDEQEVFSVKLAKSPTIEYVDIDPFEFLASRSDFMGLQYQPTSEFSHVVSAPILKLDGLQIEYDFKLGDNIVILNYNIRGKTGEISFDTRFGDWFFASLSKDGKHLILIDTYDVAVYGL